MKVRGVRGFHSCWRGCFILGVGGDREVKAGHDRDPDWTGKRRRCGACFLFQWLCFRSRMCERTYEDYMAAFFREGVFVRGVRLAAFDV